MAEIASGMTTTATEPSRRQKLDMGRRKRRTKMTDLGIPITKRKKSKRL